jgi:hypothetical protein
VSMDIASCGSAPNAQAELRPDRDQIKIFVDALFRHAGEAGFVSIRAFPDNKVERKPFRINPTPLTGGHGFIVDVAEDDAYRAANHLKPIVFCPPIAVFSNREHAREQDVLLGLELSAECDRHPQAAREKLEQRLGSATVVVVSGGKWTDPATGEVHPKLHLHWRLKKPAEGKDALAKLKRARELAIKLTGADPSNAPVCHPIRWPGSWHRKGEPVLCRIDFVDPDREIDLDEALAILTSAVGNHEALEVQVEEPHREGFDSLPDVDIDALQVSDRIKHMIRTGADLQDLETPFEAKRSERAFAALIAMVGAGCDDPTMAAVMLDTALPIGAHIRDQANVMRALARIIGRARACVQDFDLFKMNEKNAVLPIGGTTRVATWGYDPDFPDRRTIIRFSSFRDFTALQDKYRHSYEAQDAKGNRKTVTVGRGTWWIGNAGRRQYDGGMRFMPEKDEDVVGDTLNLWQGFAVAARKPDGMSGAAGCKLFLEHGRKIICSGVEREYDYLIKREAFIAQRRMRSEVGVCIRTKEEGAGKGLWERWLNLLYGQHAMQVHKADHVTGKHNKHLEVLLRLTADEALFVGDPRHRNALFGLITESHNTIEPKFVDTYSAKSYINVDITSNSDHFIMASDTARRFFVPTVSSDRVGDLEYFKKLNDQMMNEGGSEALLYHLLHEVDICDFNPRDFPRTTGLAEQQRHSLAPLDSWWVELLEGGTLEGSDPARPERAVSNEYQREIQQTYADGNTYSKYVRQRGLFDQARTVEPRLKYHTSDHLLGGYLRAKGCISGKVLQRRGWKFPPLDQCRKEWVARFPEWTWRDPDIETWCAEEEPDVPAGTTPPDPTRGVF